MMPGELLGQLQSAGSVSAAAGGGEPPQSPGFEGEPRRASPQVCAGEVKREQGWTAPLSLGGAAGPGSFGDFWVVDRVVDNWEPCRDGTAAPGAKKFIFWGVDPLTGQRNMQMVNLLA